jgi:hypothetical protein
MHPDKIVSRYRGVYAHATNGSGQEQVTAKKFVDDMRRQYPGIHEQAFPPEPPEQDEEPEPTYWYDRGNYRQQQQAGANPWDNIRSAAQNAWDWAQRVASEMASVEYARKVADDLAEVQVKNLQTNKVQIAVKIPQRELFYLSERLNPQQKIEFAQHIAAKVENEILALLMDED